MPAINAAMPTIDAIINVLYFFIPNPFIGLYQIFHGASLYYLPALEVRQG